MKMEMETCQICFNDYLARYAKDHQCPDYFCCGACGEIADHEDGEMVMNNGFAEFIHDPKLCAAQDELEIK
jgi:hypothetical protein